METTVNQELLIFCKYPIAGQAKTRLIPALGATGAAQLHRSMAEAACETARSWRDNCGQTVRQIVLAHTGASEEDFKKWLGDDLCYAEQKGNDLGERMSHAFTSALKNGAQCVLGIGTDVPTLTPEQLSQAENHLADHDLVIGPAADGGYYLIGMKTYHPELFSDINWGTGEVLRQTLAKADRVGLDVAILEELNDIDLPEDLDTLRSDHRFCKHIFCQPDLSIIIPTLNEAGTLAVTLKSLQRLQHVEIIIADGGSQDKTGEIAHRSNAKLIVNTAGRAAQLNRGAAVSRGRNLLFLHADTKLPVNYPDLIIAALKDRYVAAGAFRFKTNQPGMAMRIVEWGTNFRSTRLQIPYGDQGLFMRREIFEELGGFPPLPIMEDFAFVRKLRQRGIIITLAEEAVTSARRWQRLGVIRTTIINQLMIIGFLLRVPTEKLSRFYRGKEKR